MLSKSKQKFVRSLKLKKFRQKYYKIVVEGVKTSDEILHGQLVDVDVIYGTKKWHDKYRALIPAGTAFELVDDAELKSISSFKTPQEVLMICAMPNAESDPALPANTLCLYLESVRDPGNFGTLCRIADWFGIRNVYHSADCVDPYNPKVIQASMASLFRIRLMSCPIDAFEKLPASLLFGCDTDGTSVFDIAPLDQGLIILGNESRGLSPSARHLAGQLIQVPGRNRLGAESLNVAVAGGIICAVLREGRQILDK